MSAAPRVVLAPNPSPMTLDGTRTYLVGAEHPVVIDPGPDDANHLRAIRTALGGARPAAILLTHAHPDHAAAAPALRQATGAPVWMARGALGGADGAIRPDRWIADGDAVDSDAGPLRAVAMPGHAPEHLGFAWGDALFAGDLLMGEGDTTLVAPPEGDLGAYLRSLDRVAEIAPAVCYPTHGPPIRDPLAAVERYRAHRRERIEGVLTALGRAGPSGPAEMCPMVYGDTVPPALRPAAEASLVAVLEYLADEKRVRRLSDGRYGSR